jgi:multicomponent Na+:H+ antiporter subunit A
MLETLAPLVLSLLAAPVAALAGAFRSGAAATVGAAMAALAAGATLLAWISGAGAVSLPWAPTLGASFTVEMDGLAALYALLATGIGIAVLLYSRAYIPLHLEHEGLPERASVKFYFFVLMFMGTMVGLAMAQDLILIFVFWDLTAVASYFLIGFDSHREESRYSALMALLVTGVTAVLLLIGTLLLHSAYGTFSVPDLAARAKAGPLITLAGALMFTAGLAKSAQVPFHFWLPRAMAAPTPVSAYLHSAAMVAAGVLLIGRLYPVFQGSEALLRGLILVGAASVAVGSILALSRDEMKQLLACSTISQYGYVVMMYGFGGKYGAVGAAFYVLSHALAKSALFLTAGAVTEATGETRLSKLGGLARPMPLLAAGSGAAVAGLAALPLTVGFFKDELFFDAALKQGAPFAALALLAAVLTFAYIWRFWSCIFLGGRGSGIHAVPLSLTAPVVVLGGLVLVGGVVVGPFAELAKAAGAASYEGSVAGVEPAYHLDLRPANLLALATFGLGVLLIVARPVWVRTAEAFSRAGEVAGPERSYRLALAGLNRFSDWAHRIEVRDLRSRVAAVLLPAGALVGLGLVATPSGGVFRVGTLQAQDLPLLLALVAASVAAVSACLTRKHVTLALVVSSAGYSIAVAYAFFGAPDVALVAVLVETVLTLLILGTMRLIPRDTLRKAAEIPVHRGRRKALTACVAGAFAMVITWGTLSQPFSEDSVASRLLHLTPEAHGKDAVTVILADFRGLDTLGEISVVALVLLGVATLLNRGRLP